MYRISLFPNSNPLAETLAVLAAKSNGYEKRYTLADLKTVADGQLILYPTLNSDTTCELVGDSTLHLDRKVGDSYETVLIINEVDILELDVPTLSRYEAETILTGIANSCNDELLN